MVSPEDKPDLAALTTHVTTSAIGAGILAAGYGRRLQGLQATPKALFHVSGEPLLAWSIRTLRAAGLGRVVCAVNSAAYTAVSSYLDTSPYSDVEIIVRDTRSALYTFMSLAESIHDSRFVFMTVDALVDPFALTKLVNYVTSESIPDLILGVTDFVQDESPVWVQIDDHWRIHALGGDLVDCRYVTAGVYAGSSAIYPTLAKGIAQDIHTLRGYLKWLVQAGYSVIGCPLSRTIDVDTPEDAEMAESFVETVWRRAEGLS